MARAANGGASSVHNAVLIALFGLLVFLASPVDANEDNLDLDVTTMTRDQWQARVKAAREQAQIARRERRTIVTPPPTMDERAAAASRRVIEDDSLRPGDLVSTDQGLFRFLGHPTANDAVRISSA
jgi:hypothetical protein